MEIKNNFSDNNFGKDLYSEEKGTNKEKKIPSVGEEVWYQEDPEKEPQKYRVLFVSHNKFSDHKEGPFLKLAGIYDKRVPYQEVKRVSFED